MGKGFPVIIIKFSMASGVLDITCHNHGQRCFFGFSWGNNRGWERAYERVDFCVLAV